MSGVEVEPRRARLGRAAALITICNLASRITGFVRVVAIASALGIAYLGDAYQRANEVSNVLFELLAGGLLFSVLIPSFVERLGDDDAEGSRRLAGVLLGRGMAAVGAIALVGVLAGDWIMQVLTIGTPAETRQDQIELGVFLLWFVLPQLVLYLAGSVASALLQADHRFVATSIAPVFNNLVVIATMVAFAIEHDPARGFALTFGEKLLLGGGTLAGTVVMTAVPFLALRRAGLGIRPRWAAAGTNLKPLVRRGMWGAGHVGLNEALIGATIVASGRVDGGVIAYQSAFTFFLLPHALLAHPIFTALFPRLSRDAHRGDHERFAADLSMGTRSIVLLLVPAGGLLAVAGAPALSVVRLGQLDADGVTLVAQVLAAYLVGITGYSTYYLLTRASYALDDARSPTMVNLGVTVAAIIAMVVLSATVHGTALLVGFGLAQAVAVTVGSVVLGRRIVAKVATPLEVWPTVLRAVVAGVVATAASYAVTRAIGWDARLDALVALVAGGTVGLAVAVATVFVLRTSEATDALALVRGRLAARRAREAS